MGDGNGDTDTVILYFALFSPYAGALGGGGGTAVDLNHSGFVATIRGVGFLLAEVLRWLLCMVTRRLHVIIEGTNVKLCLMRHPLCLVGRPLLIVLHRVTGRYDSSGLRDFCLHARFFQLFFFLNGLGWRLDGRVFRIYVSLSGM